MKCLAISVSMVLIQEIFILIQCEGHSCQGTVIPGQMIRNKLLYLQK